MGGKIKKMQKKKLKANLYIKNNRWDYHEYEIFHKIWRDLLLLKE